VRAKTQRTQRGSDKLSLSAGGATVPTSIPPTFVILNLFQDNRSVTAYRADKRLHPVMLKQVQHDEERAHPSRPSFLGGLRVNRVAARLTQRRRTGFDRLSLSAVGSQRTKPSAFST